MIRYKLLREKELDRKIQREKERDRQGKRRRG